jgi:hypothetical protein
MSLYSRRGPLILVLTILGISKIWLYISQIMKTLIIHPEDPTTTFLSQTYAAIPNKTVVQGGVTKSTLVASGLVCQDIQ